MAQIFVTTYEVNSAGMEIMQAHLDAAEAFKESGMNVSERFGARGFRPCHYSSPRTLMFNAETAPTGFKLVKRQAGGVIECSPKMTTAIGKEAKAALDAVGIQPSGDDVAKQFGWAPKTLALDGERGTIYFPTTLSVEKPSPRHFLRLPRFADDGWEQHPGLTPIAESEFMRAIEDHNAVARAVREAA